MAVTVADFEKWGMEQEPTVTDIDGNYNGFCVVLETISGRRFVDDARYFQRESSPTSRVHCRETS